MRDTPSSKGCMNIHSFVMWKKKGSSKCPFLNLAVLWRGVKKPSFSPKWTNPASELWDPGPMGKHFEKKKKSGVLSELYSMFQILHSFKLTWKSSQKKLRYLCCRSKTNSIREVTREQYQHASSVLREFELRSPGERENSSHRFDKACPSTSFYLFFFFFLVKVILFY